MSEPPYNVLFLCTGNSARSILAEASLNHIGGGKFIGFSAGSLPRGEVHPLALELLREKNIPTAGLHSKCWDEFAADESHSMHFIFTVCDNAANEVCPVWPGQPVTAHWGLDDPATVDGSLSEQRRAFAAAHRILERRISTFINLPVASLDQLTLDKHLEDIGTS